MCSGAPFAPETNLATELSQVEMTDLADSVTEGKSTDQALGSVLNKSVLIVIDEFQKALDETGKPNASLINFLGRLTNRPHMPGRVLLLTNRTIERSKWSEPYAIRTLTGLSPEEAEDLLGKLLNDVERSNEIPQERRRDVVNWLGCNPRAIYVLVASIEKSSLDELIGINPEIWEARDREVSAELLHKLEIELLERTIEKLLDLDTATLLRRLSVHRKSVKRDAIEKLLMKESKFEVVRDNLINRFLMEQHAGWFSLNPVVREISLQSLKEKQNELQLAHSFAADHYMRHFQAKEIVDSGKLGGYFVEARYHLVQANRDDELGKIVSRFENYIKTKFSSTSPIPSQLEEINERIATLMALLETPGAKGLEYYLARLYYARGSENDLQKALIYIRRATESNAPHDNWLLRLRLEAKFSSPLEVMLVAREGIKDVPANRGVEHIYVTAAELLAQIGSVREAIILLEDGLSKVPVKSWYMLYPKLGEMLARTGKTDEAIALLKDGIAKIPMDQNLFSLYISAGEILVRTGKTDEAIALLQDGIAKIPVDKNLFSLYQSAGKLLIQTGKTDEAIALLQDGIAKIPSHFVGYKLVEQLLSMLLAKQDVNAIDDFLSSTSVDAQQRALGEVYKFMIAREWETAAQFAHQEQSKLPFYRPLMQIEAFCWLCAQKPSTAEKVLEKIEVQDEPFETIFWLRSWVALKLLKQKTFDDNLSIYMNRSINKHELNEKLLLELWDTPGIRTDLAYHFPILPSSLTGLPYDAVRMQYGSRVIMPQYLSRMELRSEQTAIQEEVFSNRNNNQFTFPSWMDDLLNSSETKSRADIGIVIALEEEFRELAPQINFKVYYNQDIRQYYYLFERGSKAQEQTPYHCVVTFIGAMGPTDAGIVGDRLISQFNPKTIISIGIAGSTDKDVLVGNVVVADQTDEYLASSRAIETSDKQDWDFQFSGNPFKSDPAYVAHAMNLKYAHKGKMQEWERNCVQNLQEKVGSVTIENLIRERLIGGYPEIQTGHIASGPTVGAAKQFVQWLKDKHDRKLLALEMESAGVLNAAHKRAVSSLIVRGISDYSDDRKNKLDGIGQGILRRYAMNNALSLLWLLMDLGLV